MIAQLVSAVIILVVVGAAFFFGYRMGYRDGGAVGREQMAELRRIAREGGLPQ